MNTLAYSAAAVLVAAILTTGIVLAARAAADAFRSVGEAFADAYLQRGRDLAEAQKAQAEAAEQTARALSGDELTDPDDEVVLAWERSAGNVTEDTRWAVLWAIRRLRGRDTEQGTMEDAQQILRENGVTPFME